MIRKYTIADKESIVTLLRKNTTEYFAPSEEKDLYYYLDNHAQNFFVKEVEGKIVGCGGINFSPDGTRGVISWDIFDPAYHGKGYGSELLKYRIDKLKKEFHVNAISVRTSQLTYPFYEKAGFSLKEIIKDYWAPGFDLYDMLLVF